MGRECESEILTYLFILYLSLFQMYLLEPMCQRKIYIFMLCILMNNKDLFHLIFCPGSQYCRPGGAADIIR